MHREYHQWFSPSLGRPMELLRFGHAGARVLVFPTSMGRFFEWEDRGVIGALADQIDAGWIQVICVDSVNAESWYGKWRPLWERAARHEQYERYLLTEVLPLSRQNSDPYLIVTGASFGAYHAINFAFRHPELVGRAIGLSGLYDIKEMTADGPMTRSTSTTRATFSCTNTTRADSRRSAASTPFSPSAATTRPAATTRTCPAFSMRSIFRTPSASGMGGVTTGPIGSR